MKSKKIARKGKAKVERTTSQINVLYPLGTKITTSTGSTKVVKQTANGVISDELQPNGEPRYRPLYKYTQYPDFRIPKTNKMLAEASRDQDVGNLKLRKNKRKTFSLSIAAATQNSFGINVCPSKSVGCESACLMYSGGNWAYTSNIQGKISKADYYIVHQEEMLTRVLIEVIKACQKYSGEEVAFRLNVLSDLPIVEQICKLSQKLNMPIPRNAIFYDYTKIPQKAGMWTTGTGHKYYVTFSRSEENEKQVETFLKGTTPMLIAPVFQMKKQGGLEDNPQDGVLFPYTYRGYAVFDGDESDDRMIDDYEQLKAEYEAGVIKKPVAWLGLRGKRSKGKTLTAETTKSFFIDDWKKNP